VLLNHVSLFTGIGGIDLAAERAGFETVLQVERDPYALQVLEKHWPDVPRITDVRKVNSESVRGSITVVSGGFPCQPFSAAGKRRGVEDDRYLWPELLRIVEEIRPAWVVGENVSGLLSIDGGLEIERMLASLEARDYEIVGVLHYPAAGVGAPHKRDRVFIVAHSHLDRQQKRGLSIRQGEQRKAEAISSWNSETIADPEVGAERAGLRQGDQGKIGRGRSGDDSSKDAPDSHEFNGHEYGLRAGEVSQLKAAGILAGYWHVEPGVDRVANGVPNGLDRLRTLGNAVVPAQAYPIFEAIARTEVEYETP
jgi:DNA (cytosine-5)-methyltransferase 1